MFENYDSLQSCGTSNSYYTEKFAKKNSEKEKIGFEPKKICEKKIEF